jgi:hypothetical protein
MEFQIGRPGALAVALQKSAIDVGFASFVGDDRVGAFTGESMIWELTPIRSAGLNDPAPEKQSTARPLQVQRPGPSVPPIPAWLHLQQETRPGSMWSG